MLYRLFRLNPANLADRNTYYLVLEIFWAAFLGAAANFNAPYVIRLGATNTDVGLLTAIPALVAILVSIPTGSFLQARARRKPWIMWSLVVARLPYAILAISPWLGFLGIKSGLLVVATLILFSPAGNFFNVGFTALLGDVIPENRRAAVFSARSMIYNGAFSLLVLGFGQWLDRTNFPSNYQMMYLIAFIASMLSVFFCFKVDVPDSTPAIDEDQTPPGVKARLKKTVNALRQQPEFLRFTLNTFLYAFPLWILAPLYTLYYVKELDATDAWIGLNGTLYGLTTLAGYPLWRWLMGKWGESRTLKRTIFLDGLFPVATGLLGNLTSILVYIVIYGLIFPGLGLAHLSTLYKTIPEKVRNEYLAIYMTITNAGVFVFPLLGVALANQFGFRPVMIVCGMLSLLGSTMFTLRPVRIPDTVHE